MKGSITALLSAGLMLAGGPAVAQVKNASPAKTAEAASSEAGAEMVAEMMKSMFKVEPLTAEQQARLPQAEALVARIMPPGAMQQVMGGMYKNVMGPLTAMASEPSSGEVARELGVESEAIDLDDEQAAQVAAILDPAWKERREAEMATVRRITESAMTVMEPGMRKGMAEAFAASFTTTELTDVAAFFATPSGASYASKSYALASDPRIMAAAMESLPALMSEMATMEEQAKAATANLPSRRRYADLTTAQREALAQATGLSQAEIKAGMARAEAERTSENDGGPETEDT